MSPHDVVTGTVILRSPVVASPVLLHIPKQLNLEQLFPFMFKGYKMAPVYTFLITFDG